jgi:hypothetical protein
VFWWSRCVYGRPKPYIHRYIRFICGIFGREITIHTVIYVVHIRFWPTLGGLVLAADKNRPVARIERTWKLDGASASVLGT